MVKNLGLKKKTQLGPELFYWVILDESIPQFPLRKSDANHCIRGPLGGANEVCINGMTQL